MRAVSRSIADARNRQAGLDAELGAAAVEAGGHERLAELGVQLASVSSEIDQLEDEWLALAAEAEERGLEVDG
jgi:hypothetical protein